MTRTRMRTTTITILHGDDLDCAVCHGNGEVGYNPGVGIRDPQADIEVTCPACGGTGSEADRLEREANPPAYPEDYDEDR